MQKNIKNKNGRKKVDAYKYTKTYVSVFRENALSFLNGHDERIREVKTREPEKVKVPKGFFGFSFFDLDWIEVEDKKIQTNERKNISVFHFYGGKIYTKKDLELERQDLPNKEKILKRVKGTGIKKVIFCSDGKWREFKKGHILVEIPKK